VNKRQRARMTKLAVFLRDKVKPKNFDMRSFTGGCCIKRGKSPAECGTTACVLDWCPTVFPGSWKMFNGCSPQIRKGFSSKFSAMMFFGIASAECCALFYPLDDRTPKQQARVMLAFVARKEKEAHK